ncbi:MAG TPA: cysteine peptidase family C39 domain-containing protein, partial [Armatimonadota bacterium]|nr:cysteine peptidase family C39 domain-containing protein [Armatimonadota bacterium]
MMDGRTDRRRFTRGGSIGCSALAAGFLLLMVSPGWSAPVPQLTPAPAKAASMSGRHAGYPVKITPGARRPAPVTLLNELGRLARPVSPLELAAWKGQLHHGHLPADIAAKLHIRLGEYELAANEQPGTAIWHFGQVSKHAPARLRGLAKYDTAVAGYYEGAYAETQQAFKRLLSPKTGLPGYSIKACALWVRVAGVCAGYHAQHSKMGIPEPPRLDPYCGAAALAECLRSMGRPYDKPTLVSACRVTGEGSTLQDIVDAGKKLGVVVRPLTANDAGLIALPKPVIAHVERDHFIVVISATRKAGVTYVCSDCGPWPGGKVRLTWNQWRMMDADVYGAVTRRGTARDDWMAAVLNGKQPPAQVAGLGPLKGLIPALEAGALIRVSYKGNGFPACDARPDGPVCPCFICPPKDGGGAGKGKGGGLGARVQSTGGPSSGDPVDLATGGEEYSPDADLTVYNPVGPSVSFGRTYVSLSNYGTDEMGLGWSDSLNVQFTGQSGYFGTGTDYLVMPNGAMIMMIV